MYKSLLVLFLIAAWPFSLLAQSSGGDALTGFGIETNLLAGKVIKHSQNFTAPIPALSEALDINFMWQTYGNRPWHQRRKFPLFGVGVTYTNYGSRNVFGQCTGIYADLQIPLIRRKSWEWTLRMGDGLGYVTRTYQTTGPVDTVNNAVSTHLNDFAIFMTDLRYRVNSHWNLQAGGNLTHISNADYRQPNLGANMVGVHLGVQYFPEGSKPKLLIHEDLPRLTNRWLLQARVGVAYTEARANGNPELPTYIGSVYVSRRWLSKNKVFIGTDYAFSNSTLAFLENYGVDRGDERAHAWEGAVFAGNEFLLGRVGILTQVGVFYHQTFLKRDGTYEKFGLNYYILSHEQGFMKELFISALLKTDLITAQFAEFGLGVGI